MINNIRLKDEQMYKKILTKIAIQFVNNFRKLYTISRGSVIILQNKWHSDNLSLILEDPRVDLQQNTRFVKRLAKTPTAVFLKKRKCG